MRDKQEIAAARGAKEAVQNRLSVTAGVPRWRPAAGNDNVYRGAWKGADRKGVSWKSATRLAVISFVLAGCSDSPATKEELDAIATLQRAHGSVTTDKLGRATNLYFVKIVELRDQDLQPIEQLHELKKVSLDGSPVTDAGLAYLAGLKNLRWLSLRGTKISDAGLAYLTGLSSLEEIDLEATKITDGGMESLGKISSLKKVYFDHAGPTSAGTDYLKAVNKRLEVFRRR